MYCILYHILSKKSRDKCKYFVNNARVDFVGRVWYNWGELKEVRGLGEQKTIPIVNFKQACAYIGSGVKPINIEYDWNAKIMVFYFNKQDTVEVWPKWKNKQFQI